MSKAIYTYTETQLIEYAYIPLKDKWVCVFKGNHVRIAAVETHSQL